MIRCRLDSGLPRWIWNGGVSMNKAQAIGCFAVVALVAAGLPAGAEVVQRTINVMGDVVDSSGRVVRHLIVTPVPSRTVVVQSGLNAPVAETTVVKKTVTTTTTRAPEVTATTRYVYMPEVLDHLLNQRKLELEHRISLLPESAAMMLRPQLDEIGVALAALPPGLTFDTAVSLAMQMDALNDRLVSMGGARLTPLVVVDSGGARQIALTDDLAL